MLAAFGAKADRIKLRKIRTCSTEFNYFALVKMLLISGVQLNLLSNIIP